MSSIDSSNLLFVLLLIFIPGSHPNYVEPMQNVFFFPDDDSKNEKRNEEDEQEDDSTIVAEGSLASEKFSKSNSGAVVTLSPSDSFEGGVESLMVASQFCVIESPFVRKSSYEGECTVLYLGDQDLTWVENHFEKPMPGKRDLLKPASYLPKPTTRFHVQDFNISWKLFAGRDFPGEFCLDL